TVTAGTVTGGGGTVFPTIGGVPVNNNPPPLLSLSGAGTEEVYILVNGTVSVSDGYVYATVMGTVTIEVSGSVPDPTGGSWPIPIATFVGGTQTFQRRPPSSIAVHWCDDGTNTGTANMGVAPSS
ncbi:MAG: hypothetical protein ACAI34_25310, partial [Verrucomicrobium sp.]